MTYDHVSTDCYLGHHEVCPVTECGCGCHEPMPSGHRWVPPANFSDTVDCLNCGANMTSTEVFGMQPSSTENPHVPPCPGTVSSL